MFNNTNGLMRRRCYPYLQSVVMIACLFLWVGSASAQDSQEVTGTVTDATNGEPLPGANVTVVGEPIGTATNVDGAYALDVPSSADTLRFSFIGYEAQAVPIDGRTTINIALAPDTGSLEEVVVIGYGTQEERDVTGAVESVRTEDFNQGPVVSPENLISGKVAGVQITGDGSPGGGNQIRIRGANSLQSGNEPLFVIDGVPIDNSGSRAQRNPLNFLNPNDIASMTVLKDASATAIYGSRGANGVILIETKQAGEGEGRITYEGSASTSAVTNRIQMMDADQFRELVRRDVPGSVDELGLTSTNWQDRIERQALTQEHSLSFARGYEDSDFRLSLGYLDQEGTIRGSSTERISLAFNYNQQFFEDQLSLTANLRGARTEDQFETASVAGAAQFNPTVPVRDLNSEFGGFFEVSESDLALDNPLAQHILSDADGTALRSLGNIEAEYRTPFVEGLTARLNLGYDVQSGEQTFFARTDLRSQAISDQPGRIERANFTRSNTTLDAYLAYDNEFDAINSRFDVTAGYSFQEFSSEFPEFAGIELTSDLFGESSGRPVEEFEGNISEVENRLMSGFLRVNYTLLDRYLATVTVRRDGSSRFGPDNRWGTFPSAALGWRVNEEPFMDDVDFVSSLRLRASWGVTGNQDIGDFGFLSLYTPGGRRARAQFGNRFVSTLRPSASDPSLKWEETTTYNLGVNYGLFNELVSGSVEVYRQDTDDLLRVIGVAAGSNLSNAVLTNIGEVRNEGVEATLDVAIFREGDFNWNTQFNAAYNRSEVLRVDREGDREGSEINCAEDGILTGGIGLGRNVQVLCEGETFNAFFLYEQQFDDEGNPIYNSNFTELPRRTTGSPAPDWILGHTSQLAYQNFDASFTLRAHIGNDVYNANAANFGHLGQAQDPAGARNVHTSYNDTQFPGVQNLSDFYLEDGSFLRLDNVSLGYTLSSLPAADRVRVFGTARNVFTITGYSGPDPEVGNGLDTSLYPRSRTFTAGVNIQF